MSTEHSKSHNSAGARAASMSSRAGNDESDATSLRAELNALKETVTDFISRTSADAVKTAKHATAEVASDIGGTASHLAKSAKDEVNTVASDLERMGRANPLGAIAGAFIVGVLIGLIGRGRS